MSSSVHVGDTPKMLRETYKVFHEKSKKVYLFRKTTATRINFTSIKCQMCAKNNHQPIRILSLTGKQPNHRFTASRRQIDVSIQARVSSSGCTGRFTPAFLRPFSTPILPFAADPVVGFADLNLYIFRRPLPSVYDSKKTTQF